MNMNKALRSFLAVCLCALCLCAAACRGGGEPLSSPEPQKEAQAETPTPAPADPTEAVTPAPADPTEAPEIPDLQYDGSYQYKPSYTKWLYEAARAILDGRASEAGFPSDRAMQGIVFIADESIGGAEPEYVNAFSSSLVLASKDGMDMTAVYTDPVLHIPYDTAVKAENRLYDIIEEHGPQMIRSEGFTQIEGFCGKNWFMLQSDGLLNTYQRAHTIWRTDDGVNWYEFESSNEGLPYVTGACILSDKTGFMCCYSLDYEKETSSRLFATFDGGASWQDMGLVPSEDLAGYDRLHFSGPVFDGERGVVLVIANYGSGGETSVRFGYFLTGDGGHSWEFFGLE
ncbi:MAG: hypothetical protein IJM18_10950 [Clostridia bacterium]|nr:hypothetical protein [Clostridia bacterium]